MNTLKFKIKEKSWDTPEACSFVLESMEKSTLFYKPGQFITLIISYQGKEYKRSYSLSTVAVKDKYPSFTIKQLKSGNISSYLLETLREGDVIEAHYPAGMFSPDLHPSNNKQYFLFAAGSGITPVFSILQNILLKEPKSAVQLFYSSKDEKNIIYRQKLINLEFEHSERLNVIHFLSNPSDEWQGFTGRINAETILNLINELSLDLEKLFFICGPPEYMDTAERVILEMGFKQSAIRKENYLSESFLTEETENKNPSRAVKIIYRKKEFEYVVNGNQTILQGALDNNFRIPYNCASGVCTACLGKCIEGQVEMGRTTSLTDNEKKQGLVLTCISRPLTNQVIIEID